MSEINVTVDAGVAVLALEAPDRRNALTRAMAIELVEACDRIDADAAVGAVVVTGAGGYFCAGGDLQTLAAAGRDPADPEMFDSMGDIYRSFKRVGELKPPTIAAIEGGAVGAGTNLALATDLRIVATDAKLVSGFLAINLHQGGGHGTLVARAGSRETANALSLFGVPLKGQEIVDRGLAWEAVPPGETLTRAIELARLPGSDPDLSRRVAAANRMQAPVDDTDWARGLELERPAQMWSMRRKNQRNS